MIVHILGNALRGDERIAEHAGVLPSHRDSEIGNPKQLVVPPELRCISQITFLQAADIVRFAKDDEMVKAFLFDRLHKSLHGCDGIRRSNCGSLSLDLSGRKDIQEWLGVFAIVVVHQNLAGKSLRLRVRHESFRLLDPPRLVDLLRVNLSLSSLRVIAKSAKYLRHPGVSHPDTEIEQPDFRRFRCRGETGRIVPEPSDRV